ncbi:hypothetical protein MPOCJGCO_1726 [Methylobacterium trifolii]|uniref:Transposase n=1 Tax=Methylobacterium trifolii TaxID=1003092 RepID=A0ABQ4TYL1_9HYPH|nr:hypothetical protein MPOCJGCO_1726 [Methylobacterium trifolii]
MIVFEKLLAVPVYITGNVRGFSAQGYFEASHSCVKRFFTRKSCRPLYILFDSLQVQNETECKCERHSTKSNFFVGHAPLELFESLYG